MRLRPATLDDANVLFDWLNDPDTRANSFDSKPVEWDDHLGWLSNRLNQPNPLLYIFEDNQHEPVGTARIDPGGELSYTIAPNRRGQSLAVLMLMYMRIKHGALLCRIKPDNKKSLAAAFKAGHRVSVESSHG